MLAITVDDETGYAVRLTPNESRKCFIDPRLFAMSDGLADAASEKIEIKILATPGETASDNLRKRIIDC